MKKIFNYCLVVLMICISNKGVVSAQEQMAGQDASTVAHLQENLNTLKQYYGKVNDKLKPQRDPFAYTEEMFRNQQAYSANQAKGANGAPVMLPTTPHIFTSDGMPIMKYRGFAESPSGEAIGLLEVMGMGVYTVRVGDQIGLHEIVKELVLTIEGLNRNNIIIETGKLGKKMVIQ